MDKTKCRVICAFAGSGKSTLAVRDNKVIDLDPVQFTKTPSIFPKNYINVIKLYLTHPAYTDYKILVSTHRSLLDALSKEGIHHLVVAPKDGMDKHDWFVRYTSRSDTKEFIDLMDANWELFSKDIREHCSSDSIYSLLVELDKTQYLKDVL